MGLNPALCHLSCEIVQKPVNRLLCTQWTSGGRRLTHSVCCSPTVERWKSIQQNRNFHTQLLSYLAWPRPRGLHWSLVGISCRQYKTAGFEILWRVVFHIKLIELFGSLTLFMQSELGCLLLFLLLFFSKVRDLWQKPHARIGKLMISFLMWRSVPTYA